jgi:hypothetical protein
MQLVINIKNNELVDEIMQFLNSFKDKGIEILNYKESKDNLGKKEWDEEFAKKHWREIIMNTHSADIDDDEYLYEAAARFYNEKYSD